jgi:hypothetical protein
VTESQIQSVDAPLKALERPAFGLLLRATAVGLLADRDRIDRLDLELIRDIARAAAGAGIGRQQALALMDRQTPGQLRQLIEGLDLAIIESPLPDLELTELRRTFELDQLATLLGVSVVTLRRYTAGTRSVPDVVAERAHWLALTVADLAGSYNPVGIRRWFDRPRGQLDGKSPREAMGANWTADQVAVREVRALASALVYGPVPA